LVATWIDEDHPGSCPFLVHRPIKEEGPVGLGEDRCSSFWLLGVRTGVRTSMVARRRSLFRDEVSQDLTFNRMAGPEFQLELGKLCCPLGDIACGVRVVQDGS